METPILPMCYLHKTQPLNWVCLENSCEKRLFCSHCIIFNHKEVHKNFNEISHILNDPLSQLLSSNHLKNSKTSDSLLEIVTKFAQKEEDKLTDLYNQIITEISKKFDEIRMSFHEDLIKFIKENEKNIELIDSQRKEYLKFCSNYFTKAVFENRDNLKEGLDLILSKFHSDNNLQKLFDGTVKSLPQVNIDKPLDLAIGLKKLNEIKWSFFTDKILKFGEIADSDMWTFDPSPFPNNEFEFQNNNLTIKCNSANAFVTTLLGNQRLKSGIHIWNVSVDQLAGNYVCIGILQVQNNMNCRVNYYTQAHCVCSDKFTYNLNKIAGDISNGIDTGDVLEITLDFESNVFTIKNGQQFEYQGNNVQGKEFVPYFGFSNYNNSQLSLFF